MTLAPLACASVEKGRYGVDSLRIEGAEQLAAARLRTCLLTRERASLGLPLGLHAPECSDPPFDASVARLTLWRWPWTEWPTFNKAVLDKDLERIVRWYRARGFYDARVVETRIEPPEAGTPGHVSDSSATSAQAKPRCNPDAEQCTVDIEIVVDEGDPVRVQKVELEGDTTLGSRLRAQLHQALAMKPGQRFDEHDYDEDKRRLVKLLRSASFAAAKVTGGVAIDTRRRTAQVSYALETGPRYRIGKLSVSGQGSLPAAPILAAAGDKSGLPYSPELGRDVQREVQALGAFAAVSVTETLDAPTGTVDLEIQVQRPNPHSLRLGIGVLSGSLQREDETSTDSIPQWDVHLLTRYSYKNVFSTLGELQLEERPRLIYNASFPSARHQNFGNVLSARINQPGLIEARTDLILSSSWDFGPDPFLGFQRSDITARLAAERGFWAQRVQLTLSVQQDVYLVPQTDNPVIGNEPLPKSYDISFIGQKFAIDLRDSATRTKRGGYAVLALSEAPRWTGSDWTLYFLRPQLRGYLPLPLDMVLAARLALAWTFISDASAELDPTSARLGPSVYRLRGGGANSVRGFPPGRLGVGIQGGTRRWEAMSELRLPLGESLEVAALLDFGDVSEERLYFSNLNTSVGFGLRYHSPIGALRLDTAFRVLAWQRLDGERPSVPDDENLFLFHTPGAIHFTIGEAF